MWNEDDGLMKSSRGGREGEGTNRSVWVYAACVVDMDTIIIACGLEWKSGGQEGGRDGWTDDATTNHQQTGDGGGHLPSLRGKGDHRNLETRRVKLSQS